MQILKTKPVRKAVQKWEARELELTKTMITARQEKRLVLYRLAQFARFLTAKARGLAEKDARMDERS